MSSFFLHSEDVYNTNAAEIVVPIIYELLSPRSILDVGCGLGTWLKVFRDKYDIQDILGLDGSYVISDQLYIEDDKYKAVDLSNPFQLERSFDLVVSLEVAEHLPENSADLFIESLCMHTHTVLFSAAIPGQGGQKHINEQWPEYWQMKFKAHGFKLFDIVRPIIWEDNQVDLWYRQNMFVYSRKDLADIARAESIPALVHPEYWERKLKILRQKNDELNSLMVGRIPILQALKILIRSILFNLRRGGE